MRKGLDAAEVVEAFWEGIWGRFEVRGGGFAKEVLGGEVGEQEWEGILGREFGFREVREERRGSSHGGSGGGGRG